MPTLESISNLFYVDSTNKLICATVKFSGIDYPFASIFSSTESDSARNKIWHDLENGVHGPIAPHPPKQLNVITPEDV